MADKKPHKESERRAEPRSFALVRKSERRRSRRFAATDRVEYSLGNRRSVSFLGNLSVGGMYLRSAADLTPDAVVEFKLLLGGSKDGLVIKGRVQPEPEGTRRQ